IEYLFYIKTHALSQIKIDNKAFSTINKNIDILKTVSKEFIERGIDSILKVSLEEIKGYIRKKKKGSSILYMERLTSALKSFVIHIEEFEGINFAKVMDYLMEQQLKYAKHRRGTTAANDYIPDAFCNQLVSCAIKDSENVNLKIDERIVAC